MKRFCWIKPTEKNFLFVNCVHVNCLVCYYFCLCCYSVFIDVVVLDYFFNIVSGIVRKDPCF